MADAKTDTIPATQDRTPSRSPLGSGCLDRVSLGYFVDSITDKDDAETRRSLYRDTRAMASELAGPEPSPAVLMLAETAALCWAELRRAEIIFIGGRDRTIAQADHQQRQIDRCHSRLLRTLRTLAQIRCLERVAPAVQVNVMQAVHVGSPSSE